MLRKVDLSASPKVRSAIISNDSELFVTAISSPALLMKSVPERTFTVCGVMCIPRGYSAGSASRNCDTNGFDSLRTSLPTTVNGNGTVSCGWASKSISDFASHLIRCFGLERICKNDVLKPSLYCKERAVITICAVLYIQFQTLQNPVGDTITLITTLFVTDDEHYIPECLAITPWKALVVHT